MSPGPAWRQVKTKTWFTADLHLGHRNIIDYCNRPFATVEQMNETIIARWNERVAPEDTAWLLGDIGDPSLIFRLNGRKYLVATAPDRVPRERGLFAAVVTGDGIRRSGRAVRVPLLGGPPFGHPVVLVSPFPYVVAENAGPLTAPQPPKKGPRPWLLHGTADWAVDPAGHQINVGMDVWDFAPVAADELAALIKDFTPDE